MKIKEFTVGCKLSKNYQTVESSVVITLEDGDTDEHVKDAQEVWFRNCKARCMEELEELVPTPKPQPVTAEEAIAEEMEVEL